MKRIFTLPVSDPKHNKCVYLIVIMLHAARQRREKKLEKGSPNTKIFWGCREQDKEYQHMDSNA